MESLLCEYEEVVAQAVDNGINVITQVEYKIKGRKIGIICVLF